MPTTMCAQPGCRLQVSERPVYPTKLGKSARKLDKTKRTLSAMSHESLAVLKFFQTVCLISSVCHYTGKCTLCIDRRKICRHQYYFRYVCFILRKVGANGNPSADLHNLSMIKWGDCYCCWRSRASPLQLIGNMLLRYIVQVDPIFIIIAQIYVKR